MQIATFPCNDTQAHEVIRGTDTFSALVCLTFIDIRSCSLAGVNMEQDEILVEGLCDVRWDVRSEEKDFDAARHTSHSVIKIKEM